MIGFCASDHAKNFDEYVKPLTHLYSLKVHRAAASHPFYLASSRLPPEFMLHYDEKGHTTTGKDSIDFFFQLKKAIAKAQTSLDKHHYK